MARGVFILSVLALGGAAIAAAPAHAGDAPVYVVPGRPDVPVIINGIEDVGTRSDLMDRSLIVELPRLADEARKSHGRLLCRERRGGEEGESVEVDHDQ